MMVALLFSVVMLVGRAVLLVPIMGVVLAVALLVLLMLPGSPSVIPPEECVRCGSAPRRFHHRGPWRSQGRRPRNPPGFISLLHELRHSRYFGLLLRFDPRGVHRMANRRLQI